MTARWGYFIAIPLLVSLAFTCGTLSLFLGKSFFEDLGLGQVGAGVGLANYWAALGNPLYRESLGTTLGVSTFASIGCVLFGYPLAYAIARAPGHWSAVMLSGALVASLVTAPIKVLGLIIIFQKEGVLNKVLLWLGLIDHPISLLGTKLGVVVGLMYYSLAFAVLLLYGVIRTISPTLQEAAEIHGGSRSRVMWRIVLPLSASGVYAVAVTIFNLSMGAFAAAVLMGGGRVLTVPVLIYQTIFTDTNYALGSTLSALLLIIVLSVNLISALLLWASVVLLRHSGGIQWFVAERVGDLLRAMRANLDRNAGVALAWLGRVCFRLWTGWVYLFLLAPLLVIAAASLNGGSTRGAAIIVPPRRISFDWYLATPTSHVHAFLVSITLAACATALACLIALPAALGLTRGHERAREAAATLFRLPLQVPVVIIGLAFFYTYYAVDDWAGTALVGSFFGLVLAHFFVLTPFVISSVTAVLSRFDERLEEAAASLGAGRWRTLRRVTLPVIVPGVFAGAIYAFMVSFGDVPISLFLSGSDTTTFPVEIFHSMEADFDATVLSSSTMMMGFGLVMLLLVQRLIGLDAMTYAGAGSRE
jgi:ABC-type spermidine/putrescine transport system permease subunit II